MSIVSFNEAILTAGYPQEFAFMADESVWGVLGKQNLKYDLKEYEIYMGKIKEIRDHIHGNGEFNA